MQLSKIVPILGLAISVAAVVASPQACGCVPGRFRGSYGASHCKAPVLRTRGHFSDTSDSDSDRSGRKNKKNRKGGIPDGQDSESSTDEEADRLMQYDCPCCDKISDKCRDGYCGSKYTHYR